MIHKISNSKKKNRADTGLAETSLKILLKTLTICLRITFLKLQLPKNSEKVEEKKLPIGKIKTLYSGKINQTFDQSRLTELCLVLKNIQ